MTETTRPRGLWKCSFVPILSALLLLEPVGATSALAQDASGVTPPSAQGSTDVAYPAGAQGDATVQLELTVEVDGTVSSAVVLDGVEPFAEVARATAMTWKFTPALRDGGAVAARIRARVEFHLPQRPAQATPSPAAPPAVAAPAPAPISPPSSAAGSTSEAPIEVTVRGTRNEIGQTTLSAADVREMPGAFGDPFRAVEALPGVNPVASGIPYFYVRGAPPNDNGYFVDGVRVPLLFHIGIGEGVIHPALLERVDLLPGAPPATYGGFAGGIIAGQTREPAAVPHGQANIRLFDAGALVETPFGDDRGSVLVAGRYGYPGPILGAITSSVKLGYWDYQARTTWRLGPRDTIGVFAFGSHDYLGTVPQRGGSSSSQVVEQIGSDFHRLDLRYDHALGGGRLRIAGTLGYDLQGGAGESDGAAPSTITDRSAAVRLAVDERITPSLRVRTGFDARIDDYSFQQGTLPPDNSGAVTPPFPASANPPPTNMSGGVYADVVWRPAPRLEIVPGVRAGVFESDRSSAPSGADARTTVPAIEPRLSARIAVTPTVASISTVGISHQYPALRIGPVPGLIMSIPGFPFGDSQPQRAVQASQGTEVSLPGEITLTATGFLSLWSGLTDLTASCIQIMPPTTPPQTDPNAPPPTIPFVCPDDQPVDGHAYGLELLIRRPLSKRLSGWLSYTLSRSTRDAHFVTLSGAVAAAHVASEFDRTHVLNAILAYDLGRRWRAGGRFVFYTGAPYSDLAGNVPVPPYNDHRGPPFFRVDVRLEKRWAWGKERSIALVIEGLNVTLSREVTTLGMKCMADMTPQGGTTQCTPSRFGPLTIPSIGVEAFF
jgi:TonB family protein